MITEFQEFENICSRITSWISLDISDWLIVIIIIVDIIRRNKK